MDSAERITVSAEDNFVYQRSRLAYDFASRLVSGRTLEVGTGTGYGVGMLSPHCERFITVDKELPSSFFQAENVEYYRMTIPPLDFQDGEFDCVVSFQVIEHVRHDVRAVAEMSRVLRDGGRLVISTPNSEASLTRNPWHVREYTEETLRCLLGTAFREVEMYGVVGNDKVNRYYEANRESVRKVVRFDVLDFQHRLPRQLLRFPYDILNRINRRKLHHCNTSLTESISMEDYSVVPISEVTGVCFDLVAVAVK